MSHFFMSRYSRTNQNTSIKQAIVNIITIEFMFAGINMFWARLRLILARAVRLLLSNSITINITLEGIEKIKTEKNDNKTL